MLGVINASGVISLGTVPLLLPEFDRKSEGAGSEGIFLRSGWEPAPDSLSELWSVRLSENPAEKERDRRRPQDDRVMDRHASTSSGRLATIYLH